MKPIFLFISFVILSFAIFAQQKNPTNAKEIQDKIKQAQKGLGKLSPEQKKMMEQMGISTKVPEGPVGASDASIGAAVGEDGKFGVPAKNTVLIAAIPKIPLTKANVPEYISSLNTYIEKNMASDVTLFVQQVYASLKANKYSATEMGNAAIGFWSVGRPDIALVLIGRAMGDNVADDDLMSNFSAMLTMVGAPHKAIPLLEYLNKAYPDNTTIQNNLGQAWFQLGETEKANAHLEKVARAFACHPQATYTQCLIEQSKGNTPKAIEKMKNSMKYSVTTDKISMLRKLGYKIKPGDMRMPFRPDPDPLGLNNFKRPDVPTSYETEQKLKADWDAFQKQCRDKAQALAGQLQATGIDPQAVAKSYQAIQAGNLNALSGKAAASNMYDQTAQINLNEMKKDGGSAFRLKKAKMEMDAIRNDFLAKKDAKKTSLQKENSITAQSETELAKKGENIGFDNCVVQRKYSEWVYKEYNKPLEEAYKNYLHQLYLKITEELYWKQFTRDANDFEKDKLGAKQEWLSALNACRYLETKIYGDDCKVPETKGSRYKLADFDDMHCQYRSELDFGFAKQIFECGRSRVEFNAGKLSGNLNFKDDNEGKLKFVKGNLEATIIDKSISMDKGPLQIGANVKAGMGVDFTDKGVQDVYLTAEASASAKSNIIKTFDDHISEANGGDKSQPGMDDAQLSDKGVEIGVNGRMSLISGSTSTNVFVKTPN